MAMARTATDVQPIDRLEEKIKQLVGLVDSLRGERAKAVNEAVALQQEVNSLRARLADSASASAEVSNLREERDLIRSRVSQMIATIDKLNL
jgi:regulator of replication initiation timing